MTKKLLTTLSIVLAASLAAAQTSFAYALDSKGRANAVILQPIGTLRATPIGDLDISALAGLELSTGLPKGGVAVTRSIPFGPDATLLVGAYGSAAQGKPLGAGLVVGVRLS